MTMRTRILALTVLSVLTIGWRYFLAAATILIIYLANFSVVTPVRAASNNVAIKSDADFLTCGCVSGGSGTQADPFLRPHDIYGLSPRHPCRQQQRKDYEVLRHNGGHHTGTYGSIILSRRGIYQSGWPWSDSRVSEYLQWKQVWYSA